LEIKSIPTVGWSFPSKVSKIKRFIIEVFPTDWSPRKTNLYFRQMNNTYSNVTDSQIQASSVLSQKYKLVFLGDQSVGKTSIINRFIFDTFDGKDHPTVGIDFISKTLYYDDKAVKLQLWDTAGQERFRSLIPSYIRDCTVSIVCFDVTSRQSFENITKWVEDVRSERGNDVIIVIVGNKVDLEEKRSVRPDEGESLARDLETMFIEVSAKAGHNVSQLFQMIAGVLPGNENGKLVLTEAQGEATPNTGNIQLNDRSQVNDPTQQKKCGC